MDSKTIKIEAQLYNELDRYRGKGETFSDALRKLLNVAELIRAGASLLGPIGIFDVQEPRRGTRAIGEMLEDMRADRQPAAEESPDDTAQDI